MSFCPGPGQLKILFIMPIGMTLPKALYRGAQVRAADQRAMQRPGLAGSVLMERAGEDAWQLLRSRWPRARRIIVLCGPGNNGGDGYVLARRAQEAGLSPRVLTLEHDQVAHGDALNAQQRLLQAGVVPRAFAADLLQDADVVVDAMFGIGLARAVSDRAEAAIMALHQCGAPVLALDLPSGLDADSGRVWGVAVRAAATLTFIGLKAGLFTGAGREHSGAIYFDDLGTPAGLFDGETPQALRITRDDLLGLLPRRARHAHKGDAGRVLLVGGAPGMGGALRLAGEAAYRAGAGLVRLATHGTHCASLVASRPELMVHGVETAHDLRRLLSPPSVLAVGPGLGQDPWARALWATALESPYLQVVDADALTLLAQDPVRRDNWILTPHPGEAARLLGCSTADIQHDRFAAAREIAVSFGGVCVLKGSGSLIAQDGDAMPWLCDRGNPGMASGGSGDVLTGVIAALRAQGLRPLDAARLGVWVHAGAGDAAVAEAGEIGLLASDLFPYIRAGINALLEDPCA
jgi:NAD(P)H-hydrate epimerase